MTIVPTRQAMLELIPPAGRMAEIGVFAGAFAAEILTTCRPTVLHLIDRWAGDIQCGDQDGQHIETQCGEALYLAVAARYRDSPVVRVYRTEAAILGAFEPGSLDFIYIDADHAYGAVAADLALAARVLAPTGLLGGHDYGPMFPGVMQAVNDFLAAHPEWRMICLTKDGCPSYLLSR